MSRSSRGFTLLEVMVALSILALALTSLAGIDANSFKSSNYAKHMTVATLLARSKMIDIEELIRKDGFSESDKDYSGDFSKEGFPNFKWAANARKVEMDVGQLVGAMLGGDITGDALPDKIKDVASSIMGKGDKDAVDKMAGSDLSKLLGGGMIETLFKGMNDQLKSAIREVTLEIRWGETEKAAEKDQESVTFVEYLVKDSSRMTTPPVAAAPPAGTAPPGAPPLPPGYTWGQNGQILGQNGPVQAGNDGFLHKMDGSFELDASGQKVPYGLGSNTAVPGALPNGRVPTNPAAPPRFPVPANGIPLPGQRGPNTLLPPTLPGGGPIKK